MWHEGFSVWVKVGAAPSLFSLDLGDENPVPALKDGEKQPTKPGKTKATPEEEATTNEIGVTVLEVDYNAAGERYKGWR